MRERRKGSMAKKLKKAQGNDFTRGNVYAIEKAGMVERNDLYICIKYYTKSSDYNLLLVVIYSYEYSVYFIVNANNRRI